MFVCVISDIVHLLCFEVEGVCSIGCTCGSVTCGSLGGMTWVQLWWFEVWWIQLHPMSIHCVTSYPTVINTCSSILYNEAGSVFSLQ